MKKKLLIAAGALLLLVVGGLIGVVAYSGSLIKLGVEQGGTQAMKTETTLGSAGLSIFAGQVSLANLNVRNPEGFKDEFVFSVGETSVKTNLGSLMSDTIEVEHIRIASPYVSLEVSRDGTNLGALLGNLETSRQEADQPAPPPAETEEKPTETKEQGPGVQLVVRELKITDAKVKLTQTVFGESGLELTLPELKLTDVGTKQDPASMARLMQEVVAAIMAGIIASDDLPPEIAALLRGELMLPSLDALKAQLEAQLNAGLAKGEAALKAGLDEGKAKLEDAKAQLGAKAGELGDAVGETTGELGEKAGALGEKAGEAVGEKTGELGEKTGELGEQAGEKTDELGEKADDAVEEGKKKLGGLFGK